MVTHLDRDHTVRRPLRVLGDAHHLAQTILASWQTRPTTDHLWPCPPGRGYLHLQLLVGILGDGATEHLGHTSHERRLALRLGGQLLSSIRRALMHACTQACVPAG